MAKNTYPTMKTGGMLGKLIWTLVLIALFMLVIKNPDEAAGWASGLFSLASEAVNGIAAFLRGLFG
jgi:hypothetical protein